MNQCLGVAQYRYRFCPVCEEKNTYFGLVKYDGAGFSWYFPILNPEKFKAPRLQFLEPKFPQINGGKQAALEEKGIQAMLVIFRIAWPFLGFVELVFF